MREEPIPFKDNLYLAPFYIVGERWVYLFVGEKPIIEKAIKEKTSLEKRRKIDRKEIPAYILNEFKETGKISSLYLKFKKIYPNKKLNFIVLDHKLQKRRYISPLELISEEF